MAPVVLLAGGTGGAKLAKGLLDELGPELVVIANTGDDLEIYGAHVSPDPDLVTFWLADAIDERGWGLAGDTFAAMEQLRALGENVWFNLGDRDLAIGLHRAAQLRAGARLTHVTDDVRRAFGVAARVLVPSDEPLRTWIRSSGRWHPFQEFMIRIRGPLEDVEYRADGVHPAPEAVEAIREARAIVIGPSNPVLSIDPILALLGEEIQAADAPVVAVSPLVHGQVLKGPTADCLTWAGQTLDSDGIAGHYDGIIDGLVADERSELVPTLETEVALDDPDERRRVARAVLDFAAALSVTSRMRTVAILPVKRFGRAKQRLGGAFPDRPALAAAMVGDVLDALGRVEDLHDVIVVTAEPDAAHAARAAGARVVHDPAEAGQSAAAALGIAEADADRVLLVPGDCPALDPAEIATLLAHTEPVVIVPDRHGTGTNALLLAPPDVMAPAFGPGSFARHAALAGERMAVAEVPSLRLDVDTPDDLAALRRALALRRRGAARTRALLEQAAVA